MNVRITIQENTVAVDSIGNHKDVWKDVGTFWATPVMNGGSEESSAGTTDSSEDIDFTIRYTKMLDGKDSTKIRVQFSNATYNVTSIDPMNYTRKCLKLRCEKEKR